MKNFAKKMPLIAMSLLTILTGCGDGNATGNGNGNGNGNGRPADASLPDHMEIFVNTKNPTWTSIEASLWISRRRDDPGPNKTGLVWTREGDPSPDNALGSFSGESSSLSTLIEDLVPGETYRIAAYAEFDAGTLHSDITEFTMPEGPAVGVGEAHEDGIIVYFFKEDDPHYVEGEVHGLLAAPMDAGESQWGGLCGRVGDLADNLGSGLENTRGILAYHEALDNYSENPQQCHEENDGTIAAEMATSFQHGGHSDWHLPSRDELLLLYRNLHAEGIGDFAPARYWSSSEVPEGHIGNDRLAANVDFSDGGGWTTGKEQTMRVRPVRRF